MSVDRHRHASVRLFGSMSMDALGVTTLEEAELEPVLDRVMGITQLRRENHRLSYAQDTQTFSVSVLRWTCTPFSFAWSIIYIYICIHDLSLARDTATLA